MDPFPQNENENPLWYGRENPVFYGFTFKNNNYTVFAPRPGVIEFLTKQGNDARMYTTDNCNIEELFTQDLGNPIESVDVYNLITSPDVRAAHGIRGNEWTNVISIDAVSISKLKHRIPDWLRKTSVRFYDDLYTSVTGKQPTPPTKPLGNITASQEFNSVGGRSKRNNSKRNNSKRNKSKRNKSKRNKSKRNKSKRNKNRK